jgi:hypothetical protein
MVIMQYNENSYASYTYVVTGRGDGTQWIGKHC